MQLSRTAKTCTLLLFVIILYFVIRYGIITIKLSHHYSSTIKQSSNQTIKQLSIHYGIFCTKHDTEQRHKIRNILSKQLSTIALDWIDFNLTFVIGEKNATGSLLNESKFYQDIAFLDIKENMNEGKTYEWFKSAHVNMNKNKNNYQQIMVFKADTDTFLCLNQFVKDLLNITSNMKSKYMYYGRINTYAKCGGFWHPRICPPKSCTNFSTERCWIYMSGGIYGLSLPLINAIFSDHEDLKIQKNGMEDLLVGHWIKQTNVSKQVQIIHRDNGILWCHQNRNLWDTNDYIQTCQNKTTESCTK
eukprot:17851_1